MATSDIKKGPLYVDSTNNSVGIGTTTNNQSSSTTSVTLNAASGMSAYELRNADVFSGYVGNTGTNMYLVNAKNGSLGLYTNNTERMHLTSTGSVGIGTTSVAYKMNIFENGNNFLQFSSTGDVVAGHLIGRAGSKNLRVQNSENANIELYTNNAERMRIAAVGLVTFNGDKNGVSDAQVNIVNDEASGLYRCLNLYTGVTTNRIVQTFFNGNGQVGYIATSGTSTSYVTSSDYRLKTAVEYDWDATSRLKQLKPVRFNFIADADTTVDGFLAHEVQDIVPEAISGTKDEVDEDGNPVMQGIDQSKLVPLLCKTILELEARITALEAN